MNCESIQQLIADALGNEITSLDSKTLHDHLATCPRCRTEYEHAQIALRSLHAAKAPPQVTVLRQGDRLILEPARSHPAWTKVFRGSWLRYAAMVAIAFTAGYFASAANDAKQPKTVSVENPLPRVHKENVHQSKATLESAIASVHRRHPNESALTKCLLAMAAPTEKRSPAD